MTRNKKNFVKFDDNFSFSGKFGNNKIKDIIGNDVISMQSK